MGLLRRKKPGYGRLRLWVQLDADNPVHRCSWPLTALVCSQSAIEVKLCTENLFEDKNKELGGSRDWSFDFGSHRGLPTAKLRLSTKLTNTALAGFGFWGQHSCGTFEKMLTRWLSSALPTIIHDSRLQQPDRIAKPSTPRASTPQMNGRIMPRDNAQSWPRQGKVQIETSVIWQPGYLGFSHRRVLTARETILRRIMTNNEA